MRNSLLTSALRRCRGRGAASRYTTLRDVITFDYPGVGRSTGVSRSTVAAMTKDFAGFCEALDLNRFNIVGFSLGGMVAQQFASEYRDMVRRIILLGTGPRGGEGNDVH
jgi:pimeloyl-ACP methyl ester carboxylesterase